VDNTIVWSDAFLAAYAQRGQSGSLATFTSGDLATANPADLVISFQGNSIRASGSAGTGATWQVNSATVNVQAVVKQSTPLSSATVLSAPTGVRLVADTGSSASDGVTNDGHVTFGSVASAAGYEYSLTGSEGAYQSIGSATSFLPSGLAQGSNTVYVRAFDS